MTKKELAQIKELKENSDLLYALRWTSNSAFEPDIDIDSYDDESRPSYLIGWELNSYIGKITESWTSFVCHGTGHNPGIGTASQGSRKLYSTKFLALQALRYEVEVSCAKKLLEIDKKIIGYTK